MKLPEFFIENLVGVQYWLGDADKSYQLIAMIADVVCKQQMLLVVANQGTVLSLPSQGLVQQNLSENLLDQAYLFLLMMEKVGFHASLGPMVLPVGVGHQGPALEGEALDVLEWKEGKAATPVEQLLVIKQLLVVVVAMQEGVAQPLLQH